MTTGIIAEYNPFHNGHKYMLKQIREQFPQEPIIICLSGSITQRGEMALLDKWTRAKLAVLGGANLVIELPMLKYYAEPLLRRISPTSPAYGEAVRLLKFLSYIVALSPEEIAMIPPTSIMREFIGGQTL